MTLYHIRVLINKLDRYKIRKEIIYWIEAFLFADGIKIFRTIIDKNDQGILQHDLNTLEQWSNKWLLKFHPNKCKHMTIGNNNIGEIKYSMT